MNGSKLKAIVVVALAACLLAAVAHAIASKDGTVECTLTASKVVIDGDGKEQLVSADTAKPGEVIEYTVVYSNNTGHPVKGLQATLPIPRGTTYVVDSATPLKATASTDGADFAPIPLKREVKLPDGGVEVQEVPCDEYRFLRWSVGDLQADESATVSARVQVLRPGLKTVAKAR